MASLTEKLRKDIEGDLARIDKAFLGLGGDVKTAVSSFTGASKNVTGFSKSLTGAETSLARLSKGFGAAALASGGLVAGVFAISSAATTLGGAVTLAVKGFDSFKEFAGVTKTLTFAEAITGSTKLADNLGIVDLAGNKLAGTITAVGSILSNDGNFQKYSQQGIQAFAGLETAAFRYNTVTNKSGETSISRIAETIKQTRELQKATNFATDSVSLLNAQYDIASGGFSSQKEVTQVAKASTNLSEAGFAGSGESSGALVKVLKAGGEDASQADKRAAQVFETAKIGITTVSELSSELGPLRAAAEGAGASFEDVSAALAILTTQGVSTSEAGTLLTGLLGDIAANSDSAKEALAGFSDEAGKTVQLGTGQLKEKGLAGILKGLESATKGQLPALQKIFSNASSQQAAQLLIGGGTDKLASASAQIRDVDSSGLAKEAEGKGQTLEGAFGKAFNKSQADVEDFGSGLKSNVIDRLTDTNTLLGAVTAGSAEFIGTLGGKVEGVSDKFKAIGGFIATAFSIIVPTIFFNAIVGYFPKIFAAAKNAFQQITGLTPELGNVFQGLKIAGEKVFLSIADAAKKGFALAKVEAQKFVLETEALLSKEPEAVEKFAKEQGSQVQLPESNNSPLGDVLNSVDNDGAKTPKLEPVTIDVTPVKSSLAEAGSAITAFEQQSLATTGATSLGFLDLGTATLETKGKFSGFGKAAIGALKGIGSTIVSSIASLGAFAVAGAAIAAAFAIGAGWVSTIGQLLDERTNPQIAELSTSLKAIEGNKALQNLAGDIEGSSAKLSESNILLGTIQESISRLGGAWNVVTGNVASYEQFVGRAEEAQEILRKSIEQTGKLAAEGRFEGRTSESKTAQGKLDRGLELTSSDTSALEKENQENILEITTSISEKQRQIEAFKSKGNGNPQELESLNEQLSVLQKTGEAQKEVLKNRLQSVKAQQSVKEISTLNTDVPLTIQLEQQTIRQVEGEIDFLKEKITKVFSAENIDPSALNDVFPQLQSAVGAINVRVKVDPKGALDSLKTLQKIPNFDKLIFGDLNFRKTFSEALSGVTAAVVDEATKIETIFSSSLVAVAETFNSVPEIKIAANDSQLASVNAQVAAITEELNNQATPYARQIELLAQIEQLEVKRNAVIADSNVSKEIDIRNQVLSVTQSILTAEQARIGLLSQEDKFATGLIASAQAKTQAAETELAVRKEQLSIASKEEQIKKQQGVTQLEDRLGRQQGKSNISSSVDSQSAAVVSPEIAAATAQIDSIKTTYDAQTSQIESTYNRQKELIEETYGKQKELLDKEKTDTTKTFSSETQQFSTKEQNDIAASLSSEIKKQGIIGAATAGSAVGADITRALSVGSNEDKRTALFNDDGTVKSVEALNKLTSSLETGLGAAINGGGVNTNTLAVRDTINKNKIDSFEAQGSDLNNIANKQKGLDSQKSSDLAALDSVTASQKAAADQALADQRKTEAALEAAKKDLALSSALSEARIALETFSSVVAVSQARIEEEFAAREKSIQQNSLLADSFTKISSSSSFEGSGVGADLAGIALELSNPLATVIKDAEKAFAQLDSKIQLQEQSLSNAKETLSKAEKAGASVEQLSPLRDRVKKEEESLNTSRQEVPFDKAFILIKTAADKTAAALQVAEGKLVQEFASRDKLIKQNDELASSFSNLSSTAGTLFSSSALGASLSALSTEASNPLNTSATNTQKQLAQVDIRTESLRTLARETGDAVKQGVAQGLPQAALDKLVESRDSANSQLTKAEAESATDKESITQRGIIDGLNASLQVFSSKVQEVSAAMAKQSEIFKQTIDTQLQIQQDAAQNNSSIRSADTGFLSLFGSNNPFADMLGDRQQASSLQEQGSVKQSEAIATAQQEFIDLTVLDQQLSLEQQGYENSLTQTQLLSDILTTNQGGEAQFSGEGSSTSDFLARLPQIFEANAQLTAARRDQTQERLAAVQPRLDNRLQGIQLETSGSLLSNAAGSGDPRLVADALQQFQAVRPQAQFQQVNDPSSRNLSQEFAAISNNLTQTRTSLTQSSNQSRNAQSGSSTAQQPAPIVFNTQIPINITSSAGGAPRSDSQAAIQNSVNSALQSGLSQIAGRVNRAK